MDYNIRLATITDINNLSVLKQKVWDETYRGIYDDAIIDNFDYEGKAKSFNEILEHPKVSLYVVESDNNLVGYMSVGEPIRKYKDYKQEIGLLYLRKNFQKKGIGTYLFNLASKEIKKNGYQEFFISCNKYNLNARAFYEKMGGILVEEDEESNNKRYDQVKYHYNIK